MLLALETATSTCSVALWHSAGCVAELSLHRPRKHAERLVPMIRDLLGASDTEITDLRAVAVSGGPGSYTGLRIGASTAKGLAWATGAELVGVPSLEALAYSAAAQASPAGDLVVAAFPSRREDVYVAAYRAGTGGLSRVLQPFAASAKDAASRLTGLSLHASETRLWLVGDGAERLHRQLPEETIPYAHRLSATTHYPSARHVARVGWQRLTSGQTENIYDFEPSYLKPSSAEPPRQSAFEKLSF